MLLHQLVYINVSQGQLAYAKAVAPLHGCCVDDVWYHDEADTLVNFNVVAAAGKTPANLLAFATAMGV